MSAKGTGREQVYLHWPELDIRITSSHAAFADAIYPISAISSVRLLTTPPPLRNAIMIGILGAGIALGVLIGSGMTLGGSGAADWCFVPVLVFAVPAGLACLAVYRFWPDQHAVMLRTSGSDVQVFVGNDAAPVKKLLAALKQAIVAQRAS